MIPFQPATYAFTVQPDDAPVFEGEQVHAVCSTYRLAQAMEWAGRLVYLSARPEATDAVGTHVSINHFKPAHIGQELMVIATPTEYENLNLWCDVKILCGDTLVSGGKTGQKIISVKDVK